MPARRASWLEALAAGLVGLVVLVTILVWLDDVHISTTNGLYKSVRVESWVKSFAQGKLDYSNYMYYPLMAVLCRGLDFVGIYSGMAWKQLAVVNAAFGALSLAVVFCFTRILTGRRDVAVLTTLLHLGSAFFLMLSITNEDVLPGYTLVLVAMAFAATWFTAPTLRRVVLVGAIFTFGWLLEWRLLFPALPALILALAIAPVPARRRVQLIAVLAATILITAEIVALFWDGHDGSGQIHQLLWTGKGVDTGWGGFSLDKLMLAPVGIGEYLFGGRNLASAGEVASYRVEWIVALAVQVTLLALMTVIAWSHPRRPVTLAVLVFVAAFVVGEVFNLYSQPQDPQMQLNVMAWMTVAWAIVLGAAFAIASPRARLVAYVPAVLLSLAPLAYNLNALAANRGSDNAQLNALTEIERNADPAGTVFLYLGFEGITSWQYLVWTPRWAGVCDLDRAPTAQPKFKWISVSQSLVDRPNDSTAQHAAALKREIDCAFDKGYRVFASDVWTFSAETLAANLISLRGSPHAQALYATLHDAHEGKEAFRTPRTSPYFELKRR